MVSSGQGLSFPVLPLFSYPPEGAISTGDSLKVPRSGGLLLAGSCLKSVCVCQAPLCCLAPLPGTTHPSSRSRASVGCPIPRPGSPEDCLPPPTPPHLRSFGRNSQPARPSCDQLAISGRGVSIPGPQPGPGVPCPCTFYPLLLLPSKNGRGQLFPSC